MSPDISRRNLLVGVGVLGGAYGVSTQVGIGEITTWTPPADQWPLPQYDIGRTGATTATPPRNPSEAWSASPLSTVETVVVGSERVYAGTEPDENSERPGVAALDRNDGSVVWTAAAVGRNLALYDGTLYAEARRGDDSGVVALDAATGTEQWWSPHPHGVVQILPTPETVFFEHYDGVAAVDTGSGRRRWSAQSGADGAVALGDGTVFGSIDEVVRYAPRRVSDVVFGNPPPAAWRYEGLTDDTALTVSGDTLVVSSAITHPHGDIRCLHAVGLRDGTRRWRAVPGPENRENVPVVTFPVAVTDERVFHGLRRGTDSNQSHALVSRRLADGTEQWRFDVENWIGVTDVAVAGDTLFVAHSTELRAFDRGGDTRWTTRASGIVTAVAPVEGTVFVGDRTGRVVALS